MSTEDSLSYTKFFYYREVVCDFGCNHCYGLRHTGGGVMTHVRNMEMCKYKLCLQTLKIA